MPLLEENGPCYRKASHERCSCGSFDCAQDDTGWDGFLLSHPFACERMGHPFSGCCLEKQILPFPLRCTQSQDDNSGSGWAKSKGCAFAQPFCLTSTHCLLRSAAATATGSA